MIDKPAPPATSKATAPPKPRGADRRRGQYEDQYAALLQQVLSRDGSLDSNSCAIGLTSCARKSGVSTVAANLAVHAADVLDQPVLLVDANVAHPSMQRTFGTNGCPGLVESLSGQALALDCVQSSEVENLSLLTTGSTSARMRGVYEPKTLTEFMDVIGGAFGFIVFDLPAVHDLNHCHALAAGLDGIVLVLEAESAKAEESEWAAQRLQQAGAHLMGVVLNKRRHHVPNWLYRRL